MHLADGPLPTSHMYRPYLPTLSPANSHVHITISLVGTRSKHHASASSTRYLHPDFLRQQDTDVLQITRR